MCCTKTQTDQWPVTELRRTLDQDAGYLRRILFRILADGLIERESSTADARRRLVRLTHAGQAAFAEADTSRRTRSTACWGRSTRISALNSSRP